MKNEEYKTNEWNEPAMQSGLCEDALYFHEKEYSDYAADYQIPKENFEYEGEFQNHLNEEPKEKSRKKRLRKLLYGITSMAMVFSLGSTISNKGTDTGISEQEVFFSRYHDDSDYAKGGRIIVGGEDSIGGVGYASLEQRYVDYDGKPVMQEDSFRFGYLGKWINGNGIALSCSDNKELAAVDRKGKMLYQWDLSADRMSLNTAAISDNNNVFVQQTKSMYGETTVRNSYYTISGDELISVDCSNLMTHNAVSCYGTPFREGYALCNDENGLLIVDEDGSSRYLAEWTVYREESMMNERFQTDDQGLVKGSDGRYVISNVPCIVVGSLSKGYFSAVDTAGKMALVNIETGEMYKINFHYFETKVEHINSSKYVSYTDNGGEAINYGSLMCEVQKDEKNNQNDLKYYLFDVTKHCDEDGKRTGSLACYDAIYFEDFPYLAVREGDAYFYIDLEGNVVSENYQKASTFNDFGYALVCTRTGDYYVIDSAFNKVEQIHGIDDFEIKDLGEVFWVTCDEEPHAFYYDVYR